MERARLPPSIFRRTWNSTTHPRRFLQRSLQQLLRQRRCQLPRQLPVRASEVWRVLMVWRCRVSARRRNDRWWRAAPRPVRQSPGSELGARRCLRRVRPSELCRSEFCFPPFECLEHLVALTQQAQFAYLLQGALMACPRWFEYDAGFLALVGGHSETHRCTKVRRPVWPLKQTQPRPNENVGQWRPAQTTLLRFESRPALRLHSAGLIRPPAPGNPGRKQGGLRNSRARAGRGSVRHTPRGFLRSGSSHCLV